jgi:RND family efflux transporter MFP subunit
MALDLQSLRLDLPREDPNEAAGVSRAWRYATLLFAPLALAIAVIHFAIPPEQATHAVNVRVQAVSYALAQRTENFTAGGWIEPAWPWPAIVSAQVDGRIDTLKVFEGADVKKGAVIATIDAALYEQQANLAKAQLAAAKSRAGEAQAHLELLKAGSRPEEIEAARSARDAAQARLCTLQAGYRKEEIAKAVALVAEAKAYAELRASIAARSRALHEQNQVSLDACQRDDAEQVAALHRLEAAEAESARLQAGYLPSEIEEVQAKVAEATQRVKLLEAGFRPEEIRQAQAALDAVRADESAAQAQSAYAAQRVTWCTIRAPASGRVLEMFAQAGTFLSDGKYAICSIYEPGEMQVRVDVRQEQIASVEIGQTCSIKVAARREQPYDGEVTRIDPLANLARDTVRVKIKVFNADSSLRKDMTATVDFVAGKEKDIPESERKLLLPRSAIVSRDKHNYVFLVRGGKVHQVEVKLGAPVQGGVVVESGVVFGDLVAVSQAAQLEEGTPVQVEETP